MTNVLVQPPFTIAACHIVRDEDWLDPLPRFLDGGVPADLTGMTIELFIRPSYDHPVLIKKLSTVDGTIVIDDAVNGLASILYPRAAVASLPLGAFVHFCIQSRPSVRIPGGVEYRERYRGPLVIHPGRLGG